jgi:hypothetical protein
MGFIYYAVCDLGILPLLAMATCGATRFATTPNLAEHANHKQILKDVLDLKIK